MFKEFRTAGLTRWIPDRTWHKSKNIVHAFADSIVQEEITRLSSGDVEKSASPEISRGRERYVFLHELIKQTQDPKTLRSELLNILLAGRDTTASLLSNTWFTLARRPDIWAKVQAEVDGLNGERPQYADIKDMKYLRWVLNESLRLMPVVPGNGRIAVRDTVIPIGGGADGKAPVFCPKGAVVVYHPWTFHKRKDLYGEDADEFRPERWEKLRPGWEYLPFNGGPRVCVGQQFALVEASYTTIRLMQAFPRVEARDEREWCECVTLTLTSGVGCRVALFES
jgi:cytochrome P450